MHPPHTHTQQNRHTSPTHRQIYSYFPPGITENRKLTLQNTVNAPSKKIAHKNNDQILTQNAQHKKKPNSSLPKHQRFGKNQQNCAFIPLPETPLANPDHRTHRPPQKAETKAAKGGQKEMKGIVESFQSSKIIQNSGMSSQYYQTLKMDTGQPRRKQIQKWRWKEAQLSATGLRKIEEVTFSMDSTEPETEEKDIPNEYQLQRTVKTSLHEKLALKSGGQFLTAFRKRIIQKQIVQKEKIYRNYIRSSSRQSNQQEKARLKSKMKDVLDDLYQLKKLIKN